MMQFKYLFIFIAVLILILVSFSTAFWILGNKNRVQTFKVIKESDEVFYKQEGEEYQKLSSDQMVLKDKSYIKTTTGRAQLVLVSGALISVDVSTEIQVSLDKEDTYINQFIGNTWHRVEGLAGKNKYQIETPTSVASIRGTKFAVEVTQDPATKKIVASVAVTDGKVEVGQVAFEDNQKLIKNRIDVEIGKEARVASIDISERIEVAPIPEQKRNTEWFKRNDVIDKEFDKNLQEIKNIDSREGKIELEKRLIERLESGQVHEQIRQEIPEERSRMLKKPQSGNLQPNFSIDSSLQNQFPLKQSIKEVQNQAPGEVDHPKQGTTNNSQSISPEGKEVPRPALRDTVSFPQERNVPSSGKDDKIHDQQKSDDIKGVKSDTTTKTDRDQDRDQDNKTQKNQDDNQSQILTKPPETITEKKDTSSQSDQRDSKKKPK